MDLIPKPDQVVSAPSNVAHKMLYGGVADLRPMPRTLICRLYSATSIGTT